MAVKEKFFSYLTAALGFVVGLAWNDAVKSLIDWFYPIKGSGIAAKFLYAVVLTLILVIATNYLIKFLDRPNAGS